MRSPIRARRSQAGQAFVLVAVILLALLAGVGIAFDATYDYYNSVLAGRAAAASALSGVVFMPNQFASASAVPAGSRNDATDRAVDEAKRNGFTASEVSVQKVYDSSGGLIQTQLQVTISHSFNTLFMRIFGFQTLGVKQTAVAVYLPPISIGQPGGQGGSAVSELGTGNNYYFMRDEGWAADRGQGDPFTPNPAFEYGSALSPPSTDVHQISGQTGSDTVDASLPARGGYNYQVYLPPGFSGYVQVYNAVFGPDNAATHNNCDNRKNWTTCSSVNNYYYHEEDSVDFTDKTTFNAMEYTLFQVNNLFVRSSDTELSKFTVLPIDATNWATKQYTDVNTGKTITQTYTGSAPKNMAIYHSWVNVTNYDGSKDKDSSNNLLVVNQTKYALPLTGALTTGTTYRLRVDSLNYDGTNPPGNGLAHKGYAVRVVDALGNLCTTGCSISAWDDMCFYTPIATSSGGSFSVPLFQLPSTYAGYTIYVDVYDPGDISGGGNVDLNILTPSGTVATPTSPQTVTVKDLGTSLGSATQTLIGTPSTATFRATSSGTVLYNGHWIEMLIPVPSTYSPGSNTTWSLQYVTSTGVTATDTLTAAVGLEGSPAHLISG